MCIICSLEGIGCHLNLLTLIARQETEYTQFELAETERLKKELMSIADSDLYLKEPVYRIVVSELYIARGE